MCGIAGKINLNGFPATKEEINRMLDVMQYRGPNSQGLFLKNNVGLGHLRLSIIGLDAKGNQPFFNNDKSIVLIYNGEIYNYLELRKELISLGRKFDSDTDTEVLLRAYEEWGENCLTKFNGMWSFFLWDMNKSRFFAARDRFGIKPFYYLLRKDYFIFASEIKSILKGISEKSSINQPYFYDFFNRQTKINSDETVFKEIKIILPGHYLILENGKINIKKYWEFNEKLFQEKYDYSNPLTTFRELLIDSVKLRLRSDVPIGVCLSGGVDSSIIVSIISKIFKIKSQTFSVVYKEKEFFEGDFIDAVNKDCGCAPHIIYPDSNDFFDVLDRIIFHSDEPVRMPGIYSQWHVMKCAREKVVVTLDGQGADELLGGYLDYFSSYIVSLIHDVLRLKKPMDAILKIIQNLDGIKNIHNQEIKHYIKGAIKLSLLQKLSIYRDKKKWKDQFFTKDFLCFENAKADSYQEEKIFRSFFDQELYKSFTETNLPMLLKYEDRMSMAFSLEARVPYLDYRLVEFCFGLDYRQKINGSTTKYILKEAFKDILPKIISERKDKKGFPTPTEYWFRENEMKRKLQEILLGKNIVRHSIFDKSRVEIMLNEHFSGKQNNERFIWRILTTELWQTKYFD